MELYLKRIIEACITPPGIFILAIVLAYVLLKRQHYRSSNIILVSAFIMFVVLSLPVTGRYMFTLLETYPPLTEQSIQQANAGAIVVLAGGRYVMAPEYKNRDIVSASTMTRLRYAVYLQKKTGLPVVTSGGTPFSEGEPEAVLMQHELQQNFAVNRVWVEGKSNNTWENAQFTADLLKQKNIDTILLVTHAWHMPRAMQSFQTTGLRVIAAPTAFSGYSGNHIGLSVMDFLPGNMNKVNHALHELLGMLWYKMRY